MFRRIATFIAILFGAVPLGAAGTAWAADTPTATIQGPGIAGTMTLNGTRQADQFKTVTQLVSWMATGPGDPMQVDHATLGPGYTIDIVVDGAPAQRYVLYPMAQGGARAFRPAEQPGGRATLQAWFYASVTSSDDLVRAGVPVAGAPSEVILRSATDRRPAAKITLSRAWVIFLVNCAACGALGVVLTGALAAISRRISHLGL